MQRDTLPILVLCSHEVPCGAGLNCHRSWERERRERLRRCACFCVLGVAGVDKLSILGSGSGCGACWQIRALRGPYNGSSPALLLSQPATLHSCRPYNKVLLQVAILHHSYVV